MAERLPINLDEGDATEIHSKLVAALRTIGLAGAALDEAASKCFRSTVQIVERERERESSRRASIKLVE